MTMTDIVAAATAVSAAPAPAAPQPAGYAHSLADLQAEALERYGMTPAQTLAAAQQLYARNLITCPNTEERRLPEYMFEEAASIIGSHNHVSGSREHDPEYQAPCWVRHVLDAEMGIMLRAMPAAALFGVAMSEPETRIYSLVHARFLSLFQRPSA
jgi:DNA topoisomerase IA